MSDYVTFEAVTNREDWDVEVTIYDPETGDVTNLTTLTAATLAVRDAETQTEKFALSLGSGLTVTSAVNGILSIAATAAQMRLLCAENYDVGLVVTIGGDIRQVFVGTLPVEDGIIT